ncbi:hypothetical protein FACS18949_10930 [Clostridia bacterium]|nr:hypothetical protein FACS18949_10930 [Clostridia bacterium]
MKLYIKQRAFSWRDKTVVKDESGADKYFGQGEIFSWGRKFHIYDASGAEVAFLRQKLLAFMPKYYIQVGGREYVLGKHFTLLNPRFYIEGLPWTLEGDFWAHEYAAFDSGRTVFSLSKKWFTWGDSYELDFVDPQTELLCLCAALTIDCMNADAENNSAAASAT